MSNYNPDGSYTSNTRKGYKPKASPASTKGKAMAGKETKPEPITKPVKSKGKPAPKKGKMPAELVERFKRKAEGGKSRDKPTKVGASAKREERMAKKADAKDKRIAARKQKKAAVKKKPLDRDAKGKVIDTKSATRRSDPGVAKKTAPPKRTKGTKHVGQERKPKKK